CANYIREHPRNQCRPQFLNVCVDDIDYFVNDLVQQRNIRSCNQPDEIHWLYHAISILLRVEQLPCRSELLLFPFCRSYFLNAGIIRQFIDDDKILAKIEEKKSKPQAEKKKSSFQKKMEDMMRAQQAAQ